ncbi:MAG: hypothetical protein RBT15_04850 [Gudongella sp.]|nr:hypothetical protein [Gudongella sp.]
MGRTPLRILMGVMLGFAWAHEEEKLRKAKAEKEKSKRIIVIEIR